MSVSLTYWYFCYSNLNIIRSQTNNQITLVTIGSTVALSRFETLHHVIQQFYAKQVLGFSFCYVAAVHVLRVFLSSSIFLQDFWNNQKQKNVVMWRNSSVPVPAFRLEEPSSTRDRKQRDCQNERGTTLITFLIPSELSITNLFFHNSQSACHHVWNV
jgi:hypothetical protein